MRLILGIALLSLLSACETQQATDTDPRPTVVDVLEDPKVPQEEITYPHPRALRFIEVRKETNDPGDLYVVWTEANREKQTVEGLVRNTSSTHFRWVEVFVHSYDLFGEEIDMRYGTMQYVRPGETATFSVKVPYRTRFYRIGGILGSPSRKDMMRDPPS
jgi:hypothetical protein